MTQTKSKRSLAMEKRWKEKKAATEIKAVNTANTVARSSSAGAQEQTPRDILESRVNNLRSMWDNSLDALTDRRDQLERDINTWTVELKQIKRHIEIRLLQLRLVD